MAANLAVALHRLAADDLIHHLLGPAGLFFAVHVLLREQLLGFVLGKISKIFLADQDER